jgi:hypothetical protein
VVVSGENMAKLWGIVLILCGVISALHNSVHVEAILHIVSILHGGNRHVISILRWKVTTYLICNYMASFEITWVYHCNIESTPWINHVGSILHDFDIFDILGDRAARFYPGVVPLAM